MRISHVRGNVEVRAFCYVCAKPVVRTFGFYRGRDVGKELREHPPVCPNHANIASMTAWEFYREKDLEDATHKS